MKPFSKTACLLSTSALLVLGSTEAFVAPSISSSSYSIPGGELLDWQRESTPQAGSPSSASAAVSSSGYYRKSHRLAALFYSRSPSNHDFHDPFYQPQQEQQQQNTPPFRYRPQRAHEQSHQPPRAQEFQPRQPQPQPQPQQEPPTERFQFHQNVPRSSTFRERVNRRHNQEAHRSRTANPNHAEPRTAAPRTQQQQTHPQQTQQQQTHARTHPNSQQRTTNAHNPRTTTTTTSNSPRNPFRQQQQQAQAQAQAQKARRQQPPNAQQQRQQQHQQQTPPRYNTQRTQSQSNYQQAPHAPPPPHTHEDHRLEQDHYSLLGVHPDATSAEIKKAYRQLAKRFHPDVTTEPDDHEFFKLVNRAYQVLLTPEARQEFDQLYFQQGVVQGSQSTTTYPNTAPPSPESSSPFAQQQQASQQRTPPPFGAPTGATPFEDEVEIVEPNTMLVEEYMDESLFRPTTIDDEDDDAPIYTQNGMRWKVRAYHGSDDPEMEDDLLLPGENIRLAMEIDAKTAWQGGSQIIDVQKLQPCSACYGTGEGSGVVTCADCGGTGEVVHHRNLHPSRAGPASFWNHRTSSTVCPTCNGAGELPVDVCPTCMGTGSSLEMKHVPVTLPPGVEDGSRVILQRQGHAGERGGPPGDLVIDVSLWDDPRFPRHGDNVFTTESISYVHAILGGVLLVPLVDGRLARLEIPPGTQPGQVFLLQGVAGNHLHDNHVVGDHYVKIQVRIPTRITPHQRDLIRQLE